MNNFIRISLVALIGCGAISCKKDVAPSLIVTVVDELRAPLENQTVISHPCYANDCNINSINESFLKQSQSNTQGQVTFDFTNSAVLDIVVVEVQTNSVTKDTTHLLLGRNVVSLETKELGKDEKNEYETLVIVN